jgi:hypothetical protein
MLSQRLLALTLCLAGFSSQTTAAGDDTPAGSQESIQIVAGQKDFVWLEPMLVTVRLRSGQVDRLPATAGPSKLATLRFEVDPPVKPRAGAKPLPLEAQSADDKVQSRLFDLFEWLAFPDKGTWKIRVVLEHKGGKLASAPIDVTIRRPAKDDAEHGPVDRIHHVPWTNYDSNAFCGDTFDVVKRWPESRLSRYCHYWNGRHSQTKKEYDKAIASYQMVLNKYPDFALADHAELGIVECLCAQKKLKEAQGLNTALRQKLDARAARTQMGATAVQRLAAAMSQSISRDLGQE